MSAFRNPQDFVFVPALQAAFPAILTEVRALAAADWIEAPDSLTTVEGAYDERGWHYVALFDPARDTAPQRARCPVTAAACAAVPGLVNAGLSRFRPGTHLYPHRGELQGVLRCHLPLVVPDGDVGLRFGTEMRRWQPGRCLVFDDTIEHEAWNHAASDRVVLIVTFSAAASRSA